VSFEFRWKKGRVGWRGEVQGGGIAEVLIDVRLQNDWICMSTDIYVCIAICMYMWRLLNLHISDAFIGVCEAGG